ncbi:MAG: heparinase, partial [Clostridia bacterium]
MKTLKLINTIKYLKFIQIYYRLHYFFIKPATKREVFNIELGKRIQAWQNNIPKQISMLSPTQFVFLNHVGQLNKAE